ncbi:MAG: hypothetical protein ACLQMO_05785 [Acidobacteriaceae bacterium]
MGRAKWTTRLTVEDCPILLSAPDFLRMGLFRMSWGSGELEWRYETDGPSLATLSYEIKTDASGNRSLRIYSQIIGTRPLWVVRQHTIPLLSSLPHFGGERFWFRCACGRRVGRLYLRGGAPEFRCRQCLGLTYESAQSHDARVYEMARCPGDIYAALRKPGLKELLMAYRAAELRSKWIERYWRAGRPCPFLPIAG